MRSNISVFEFLRMLSCITEIRHRKCFEHSITKSENSGTGWSHVLYSIRKRHWAKFCLNQCKCMDPKLPKYIYAKCSRIFPVQYTYSRNFWFSQVSDNSGIQLTFNEIRERTIRAALNLQARGFKPGQVFGIIAKNSHNVAPIVFASFCIGCPISVLDTSFGRHEIKHMFSITKPSLVFCDDEVYDNLTESLKEIGIKAKIILMDGERGSEEKVDDLLQSTGLESTFM